MSAPNLRVDEDADIIDVLTDCAAGGTPALVLPIDMSVPCQALFLRATDEEVVLATGSMADDTILHALGPCLVSFRYETRVMAFLSKIRGWDHGQPPRILSLELPQQLLALEHRRLFRIPLRGDHGLEVRIVSEDGRSWKTRPLDVSTGGMLTEFSEDPDLPIGTNLTIEISLSDEAVKLAAVVRHRGARRYGLSFSETDSAPVDAPEPLQRIVARLQERWLKTGPRSSND